VTQDFYRYPTPEYKWNYVDELICGYNDAPGKHAGWEGGREDGKGWGVLSPCQVV
jgi:hypothetical protein